MAEPTALQEYMLNKAVESRLALWNALLTVNGIMLTMFSLVPLISDGPPRWKWLLLIVVGSCFLSLTGLVWNFVEMKRHYGEAGSELFGNSLPGKEQRRQGVKKDYRRHAMAKYVEGTVIALFFFQISLSCVYLYLSGVPWKS
jgi:hypothetical protein